MNINLSVTLDRLLAEEIARLSTTRDQEKADMQAMNAFMDKAGLLTDDDFFGGL